jgi:trans-2,3-dihydro-3-hydroxyanthranilate isomerase
MQLQFYTLDVFTEQRFTGNPLAVVMDADGLDTSAMQRIAREFNLSETVFVMKPDSPAHNAKIRIFTPGAELPFAGHPTVGTAILLAELRAQQGLTSTSALVALEEKVGVVRAGVRRESGRPSFAEFDAPRLPAAEMTVPSIDDIAAAVNLMPSEIGFANHRPLRITAGMSQLFVPVRSLSAIAKAAPNVSRWNTLCEEPEGIGTYLYTGETQHSSSHFHARMFAPHHGVLEDPATGSAAAAFAAVLATFDTPHDGTHKRRIEQGYEMGRPSLVHVSFDITGRKLTTVRIGGHAVQTTAGQITVSD